MKKQSTELLVAGIVTVAIVAIVAGAWEIKSVTPLEKAPAMSAEKIRASNKVVNDMSRELLTCYGEIDTCGKRLNACVDAYLERIRIEALP